MGCGGEEGAIGGPKSTDFDREMLGLSELKYAFAAPTRQCGKSSQIWSGGCESGRNKPAASNQPFSLWEAGGSFAQSSQGVPRQVGLGQALCNPGKTSTLSSVHCPHAKKKKTRLSNPRKNGNSSNKNLHTFIPTKKRIRLANHMQRGLKPDTWVFFTGLPRVCLCTLSFATISKKHFPCLWNPPRSFFSGFSRQLRVYTLG